MKLCVLIPAYNCAHVLPEVIRRIPLSNDMDEIIVADDASQDNTFSVATNLPRVHAVRNHVNLGYGGTSQKLYQIALERGADFAINLHGDFGHRPEDVGTLSKVLQSGEYDIVTGSRLLYILDNIKQHGLTRVLGSNDLRGNMPLVRVLGHIGLTWFQNICYETHLHSFHEGMRGVIRSTIEWILESEFPAWYNYDTELLINANSKGLRIHEVMIPPFYDDRAKSSAPPFRYGIRVAAHAIKTYLNKN
jgi:glycosyltransferase involved in cell wall biosynthesis